MTLNLPFLLEEGSTSLTTPPKVPTETEGQRLNCTAGQPSNWSRTCLPGETKGKSFPSM